MKKCCSCQLFLDNKNFQFWSERKKKKKTVTQSPRQKIKKAWLVYREFLLRLGKWSTFTLNHENLEIERETKFGWIWSFGKNTFESITSGFLFFWELEESKTTLSLWPFYGVDTFYETSTWKKVLVCREAWGMNLFCYCFCFHFVFFFFSPFLITKNLFSLKCSHLKPSSCHRNYYSFLLLFIWFFLYFYSFPES